MYVILKARDTIDGGYMYIIIKLKEIREQKNLSLGDLAKKTGISKSHLNYIEKGEKEPGNGVSENRKLRIGKCR